MKTTSNGSHASTTKNRISEVPQANEVKKDVAREAAPSGCIILPELEIRSAEIRLVGESSLIMHAWDPKARQMMLDKQKGEASVGRKKKDPQADYESSIYRFPDGRIGFPSIGFKIAAVEACTSLGKTVMSKVAARQSFHVMGELTPIIGEPRMREDMVRVGQGTADIRFRAEFFPWSALLSVRYNARVLSLAQLLNLFNTAGFAVGVGEWRTECDGQHGLFRVDHATQEATK